MFIPWNTYLALKNNHKMFIRKLNLPPKIQGLYMFYDPLFFLHNFSAVSISYTREEFNTPFIETHNHNSNSRFPTVYLQKHQINTGNNKSIRLNTLNNIWGINRANKIIKNIPKPMVIFQSPSSRRLASKLQVFKIISIL